MPLQKEIADNSRKARCSRAQSELLLPAITENRLVLHMCQLDARVFGYTNSSCHTATESKK
jgi:hypothetical protein